MGQIYLQRFVYGEGVTKAALDQAWDEAFGRYQMFHNQTYGHVVHVTFEPLWDMDRAFEPTISALK